MLTAIVAVAFMLALLSRVSVRVTVESAAVAVRTETVGGAPTKTRAALLDVTV